MASQPELPFRPPRKPLMARAELLVDGKLLDTVQIRNLSARGVGGSGSRLHNDQELEVRLAGIGLIPARVIWTRGPTFGLELCEEVHVDDFDIVGDMCGSERFILSRPRYGTFRR